MSARGWFFGQAHRHLPLLLLVAALAAAAAAPRWILHADAGNWNAFIACAMAICALLAAAGMWRHDAPWVMRGVIISAALGGARWPLLRARLRARSRQGTRFMLR